MSNFFKELLYKRFNEEFFFKVDRSVNLLNSLSSERARWESSNESFSSQMQTILGDCILNAAFITYAGYYDQIIRNGLFNQWSKRLTETNVPIRKDISRNEARRNEIFCI